MAVDTRDKRFAMMYLAMPWLGHDHPNADGAITKPDRQQFLWGYPGIAWQSTFAAVKAIVAPVTMSGGVLLRNTATVHRSKLFRVIR